MVLNADRCGCPPGKGLAWFDVFGKRKGGGKEESKERTHQKVMRYKDKTLKETW